jgi:transposase-like protein
MFFLTNQNFRPMNFKRLQTVLQDDIIDWCMQKHLLVNHHACNHCKFPMSLINNDHCPDKKFWRCKRCKKELSIRKDSLFFGSHIKISIVLELLYWWCSKMSVTQAAKECDCNKETAVEYYKIFRSICVEMSMGGPRIGGPGTIVEINEMKLGKRKFHRGKRVEGQWCLRAEGVGYISASAGILKF